MELRIQGVNSFAAGPAWASYDVDAATMHMERHERGIHAFKAWYERGERDASPFRRTPQLARSTRAGQDQLKLLRHDDLN